MQPGIHIIGLGIEQPLLLSASAQEILATADLVIGSERQLALVSEKTRGEAVQQVLPKLSVLEKQLKENSDAGKQRILILASGDPLLYGIGRWFSQRFPADILHFYPAVSSLQGACHKLGISLQDCQMVSLHGRPVESIRRYFRYNSTLLILTDEHSHPQRLAQECVDAGFGNSSISIVSDLGYSEEGCQTFKALALAVHSEEFSGLHVAVISLTGKGTFAPQFPGIPDEHFITGKEAGKGMITKKEVRLNILSLLQPADGDVAWDIGAGCGGLAVEWAYWTPASELYAIEHHDERYACLEQNRDRFGVMQNLKTIQGRAPDVLSDLPVANKIFIGGSGGELKQLLHACWEQLPLLSDNRSVLVASAVTEETRSVLTEFTRHIETEMTQGKTLYRTDSMQIAVSRQETLAGQTIFRPALPVTLFVFEKLPGEAA